MTKKVRVHLVDDVGIVWCQGVPFEEMSRPIGTGLHQLTLVAGCETCADCTEARKQYEKRPPVSA